MRKLIYHGQPGFIAEIQGWFNTHCDYRCEPSMLLGQTSTHIPKGLFNFMVTLAEDYLDYAH